MKKQNNDGLTLVEMLICMLISLVIITAVGGFMSASSISYQSVDSEITLQMEAQTVINQISDMILEGNNVYFDTAEQTLTIYRNLGEKTVDGLGNVTVINRYNADRRIIWFAKSQKCLYLYNVSSTADLKKAKEEFAKPGKIPQMGQLLGEYITDFSCSATEADGIGSTSGIVDQQALVNITVSLANKRTSQKNASDRTYIASNDVALRNEIVPIQ